MSRNRTQSPLESLTYTSATSLSHEMSNESAPQSGSVSYSDNASSNIAITGGVQGDVIINKPSAPPFPQPRQFRKPVADFTGREKEVAALLDALRDGGRSGISGISGMGGIGKTEFALMVAGRLRDNYPDAQLFVEMRGLDERPRQAAEALASCIRAFLGPEAVLPDGVDDLTRLYLSVLSGKRALVLIDNAADSEQVRPLIPPQGSSLLVTSRLAIKLPGLVRVMLDQLNPEEASALLRQISPRVTPEEASRICHLCGYLPLAIRAAGSLLDVTPDLYPAEYASQLLDERTRLESIGVEGVEIGVEASFNLSYTRLNPETARVFRCLAAFRGDFDAAAEESICGDTGHRRLSELVRRSLALYEEKTERYRLHDLVRVFADSRMSEAERHVARRLYAQHYQGILSTSERLYLQGKNEVLRGLGLFDLERANIEAGQGWAVGQADSDEAAAELCITYPVSGVHVLNLRQHPHERIRWLEAMLAAARRLKRRDAEGSALGNLGLAYADLGETRRAIDFHEKHLVIVRETGDRISEGNALGNLGLAYVDLGEPRRAIEFYEQVLQIMRETGDRRGEGTTLGNLGAASAILGQTCRAIGFHKQALRIARETGDRRSEGTALGNLGASCANVGRPRRAIAFYKEALQIARETGDRRGEGRVLGNLGMAHTNLGEPCRAIDFHEEALRIARETGDRRGEGTALDNLGSVYADLGELRRAIDFHEEALEIARETGDRMDEGTALWGMALALDRLGDRARAMAHAEAAIAIYQRLESLHAEVMRNRLAEWKANDGVDQR